MFQRVTTLGLSLCLGCLVSGVCGQGATNAPARGKPQARVEPYNFEGMWNGKFKPDHGKPGEGTYEFGKEKDGGWDITVSWVDEHNMPQSMKVRGERLGPDAVRLEGKNGATKYWYIGRLDEKNTRLVLRYLSVNEKGESGTGVSELTRPK